MVNYSPEDGKPQSFLGPDAAHPSHRRIDKTPKKTYGIIEKKTVIEFEHEDVLQILAEFIKDRYNIIVNEDDFFLDLQEARVNEGYSSNGKNQKARICLVRVEKYD